jgi:hypothetical protein
MKHLDEILNIMEDQSLYAKESKCEFGMTKILYLGHVVSAQGEMNQLHHMHLMNWNQTEIEMKVPINQVDPTVSS